MAAGLASVAAPAAADGLDVAMGKALFDRNWVTAPASTVTADGLGPLFNARSCNACHAGGGPARFLSWGGSLTPRGLVVRSAGAEGLPHPELGAQIQTGARPGLAAEGKVVATLRGGALAVEIRLAAPVAAPAFFETRIAPSLRGRGAIAAVDPAAVVALADPDDRDGNGISGRPNLVDDGAGRKTLGRFGRRAGVASLEAQTAAAAALDMGLSSPQRRQPQGDCTTTQTACLRSAGGRSAATEDEEMSGHMLQLVSAYVASLAAPAADLRSPGFAVFRDTGCAACHVPALPDRAGTPMTVFSDLLLHDMGPAHASSIEDGDAAPREWRTAPLRDLDPRGGTRRYLHDGSAADIGQAIERHDGEAASARAAFRRRDGREKQLLLDFLAGL